MPGLDVVTILFAVSNALRMAAYFPQIVAVWRDEGAAEAVSIPAWGLFALANITTVVYAMVTLQDSTLAVIFTLNAVCCILIVGFTFWKRSQRPVTRTVN